MFLQLDGTFWVQLINFGIFYAILRVVFLQPVGRAIAERRAYIDGVQRDLNDFTKQTQTLRAEADAKRAMARREAGEFVAGARAKANDEAQAVAGDYGGRAAKIADDARRTVDGELASARAREPELAGTLAQSLLDRAIGALGG
jgi:F0F1-type ATP synthase membrane subunit b/b'